MPSSGSLIPAEQIARIIYVIRGHRVMLDADLAILYGVTTKRLNEAVKRNLRRFPEDFMFQLTPEEFAVLRSQNVTSNAGSGSAILKSQFATSSPGWGGRRKLPRAFTEHGAVMLASVLNSPVAVGASIQVVRAFVQLRGMLTAHAELARKRAAEEAARRAAEEEGRRKAEEEHKKRLAEEDARKKAEEEVKRKADALVQKRLDQAAVAQPQAPIARQAPGLIAICPE